MYFVVLLFFFWPFESIFVLFIHLVSLNDIVKCFFSAFFFYFFVASKKSKPRLVTISCSFFRCFLFQSACRFFLGTPVDRWYFIIFFCAMQYGLASFFMMNHLAVAVVVLIRISFAEFLNNVIARFFFLLFVASKAISKLRSKAKRIWLRRESNSKIN